MGKSKLVDRGGVWPGCGGGRQEPPTLWALPLHLLLGEWPGRRQADLSCWASTTLTFPLICLQLAMAKRLQARRLDGIDHNPW